jgi:hypothetical protein
MSDSEAEIVADASGVVASTSPAPAASRNVVREEPSTVSRAAAPPSSSKEQRFRTWNAEQKEQLVVEMTQGSIKVLMHNKVSNQQELTLIDPAVPFPHKSKGKFYEMLVKHLVTDKAKFPLIPKAVQCEKMWDELLTTRLLHREKLKASGTGHKRKRVGEYRTGEGAGAEHDDDASGSDEEQEAAEKQDRVDDLLDAFIARQENLRASVAAPKGKNADAEILAPHVEKAVPKEKVKESQSIEEASNGKASKKEKLEKLPSCADKAKQQMMEDSTSKISGGLDKLSMSMQSDSKEVFVEKAQAVIAPIAQVFKDYHESSLQIAKAESQAVRDSTERQWEGITKCFSDSVNAFKDIYIANNPRGPQACVGGQQHSFAALGGLVLCTNCGIRA